MLSIREVANATTAFKREALLLASLSHQNLPRIYDHFSEHGNSYLVMDFIDGEILAGVLRQAGGKGPPSILVVKREIQRIKHEVQGGVYCGLVAWREIHCFRRGG